MNHHHADQILLLPELPLQLFVIIASFKNLWLENGVTESEPLTCRDEAKVTKHKTDKK